MKLPNKFKVNFSLLKKDNEDLMKYLYKEGYKVTSASTIVELLSAFPVENVESIEIVGKTIFLSRKGSPIKIEDLDFKIINIDLILNEYRNNSENKINLLKQKLEKINANNVEQLVLEKVEELIKII